MQAPWLQIVDSVEEADPSAAAVLLRVSETSVLGQPATRPGQLWGLVVTSATFAKAIPFAIAQKADLVVLDGSGCSAATWADLAGAPDLSLLPGRWI